MRAKLPHGEASERRARAKTQEAKARRVRLGGAGKIQESKLSAAMAGCAFFARAKPTCGVLHAARPRLLLVRSRAVVSPRGRRPAVRSAGSVGVLRAMSSNDGAVRHHRATTAIRPIKSDTSFVDAKSHPSLDGANNLVKHGAGLVAKLALRLRVARKLLAGIRHITPFHNETHLQRDCGDILRSPALQLYIRILTLTSAVRDGSIVIGSVSPNAEADPGTGFLLGKILTAG
jgi:hypothetical protein